MICRKIYNDYLRGRFLTACMRHAAVLHFSFFPFSVDLPQICLSDGSNSSQNSSKSSRENPNSFS